MNFFYCVPQNAISLPTPPCDSSEYIPMYCQDLTFIRRLLCDKSPGNCSPVSLFLAEAHRSFCVRSKPNCQKTQKWGWLMNAKLTSWFLHWPFSLTEMYAVC
jgi:hypothetical protein